MPRNVPSDASSHSSHGRARAPARSALGAASGGGRQLRLRCDRPSRAAGAGPAEVLGTGVGQNHDEL
jgi:hypothetical protein